ncbi:glycosyltransferase [Bacillus sp. MRMR6]|uniref:glycosyltransferase n=1 Tax=Bacillus sp. MRMR6 TaxID=1928617 RepID=UPI0009526564|nr:glycosyltransferase [Bacillus sp. MRMR6]OLS38439.1 hypothetical protein BTR25_14760 [Bacillus sp. MRMR6]
MKSLLFILEASEFGGVEKSLIDLIEIIKDKENKITVLSIYKCLKLGQLLPKEINYQYIFEKQNILINRFFKVMSPKLLPYIFIKNNYDYVVAYQEGIPTKIVSGINTTKTKKYNWMHNDPTYNDNNIYYFFTKDRLLTHLLKFNKRISVSHYIQNQYNDYLSKNVDSIVIYNAIDEVNVRRLAESDNHYPFDNGLKICCIGRLSEEKNFIAVISTIKKIRDENYDVNLTIIGSGPEKSNLLKAIKTYNLEQSVKILNFVDNPYVYMKKCDVIVCSSKVESFGLVVAEAMVLNKFILSTKCGGPEELLKEYRKGILLESDFYLYDGIHQILLLKNMENNISEDIPRYPFSKAVVLKNCRNLFS